MAATSFPEARILIVDDELVNVMLLTRILQREGYTNVLSTTDPREVFGFFTQGEPDLILLDLMMPEMSGFEVMDRVALLIEAGSILPILILTADLTAEAMHKSLDSRATDFLTKPFDHSEVVLRIRNLLTTRALYLQLRSQNQVLEDRVQERTADLEQAKMEILQRLARAGELRDDDTGQHTQRVARASGLVAQQLGMSEPFVKAIRQAAPLHDVGKIGISDLILLKPGKLTDEEFATMKTHAATGARLLAGGTSNAVQMAERIAHSHHERWDGRGYPQGLSGEAIPQEGRILATADVFDALTHERPYKKAWPVEEAVAEITRQSGQQFDPAVVEAFLRIPHEDLL